MYIYFSLLISILGCAMYLFSANHKIEEVGRLAFFCGLLAFLLQAAGAHFGIVAR